MIFILIVISVVIIGILIFYRQLLEKKKYQDTTYLSHLQKIPLFFDTIQKFDDYLTWVQRDQIKIGFSVTGQYFKNKSDFYKKEETVKKFNDIFQDFDNYVANYNRNYILSQKEKLDVYFDDIEGKKLDDQQRTAIITDEYSNLIIAGAGSGKTLTILGKVKYLIEHKNVKPENILLLSFTKKTVDELNERLKNIGLGARATTFHKLGYDTIKKHQTLTVAVTNENTLRNVVNEYLEKEIFNNTEALEAYIVYVSCFMNIPEENESYDSLGEKIDTEKGIDFQTLKSKCEPESLNKVALKSLDTIQGEKVKSVEELTIANFLYLNGIEYDYEKPYPFGNTMYRPDFYLKDYDIYLEHFGIDESNRAKWLTPFNEERYIEEMELKRETHKTYNTKLLETYSYYNRNNVLLDKLTEILSNENVIFKPRDVKNIYTKVKDNDKNFGKEITNLIQTFINLSKSRQLNYDSIISLFSDKSRAENEFMLERQNTFLKFALPILKKYDNKLKEKSEIDFNDMINQATDLIKVNQPEYSYQHIIIDEYQDISFSRFNLIKEIRDLSGARLICVGDDWQSIYRFAGSDISLFSNFEKHVGKYEQLFIEQTYRNSQSLIDITSKYIQKNKKQIQKNPKSKKEPLENPIKFVYYSSDNAEDMFINEVQALIDKNGNKPILVLGRHSFDINEFIKLTPNSKIKYYERSEKLEIKGFEDLNVKYITVHKSKGLESDNVIVLNLKNHLLGFPNKMTDDPMLSLLLSDDEEYRFAEERRLFYVALTRTKNEVVLLIPTDVSLFAEELATDNDFLITANNEKLSKTNCPYCQTGHLVIRLNALRNNQFLGCSHYPSCNQTFNDIKILENTILCPSCKSGFMTKRSGKFGYFLGCTNYPICKNTINL
ncbi:MULTISPECIES: UvrD-helicase domain-containing protein [Maribacter]|uniref:DNA 3'-5' helicase n=1 Tax=Maribacter flavus TaxID=1658664 RepID=A0ABU7IKB7_9FLAO|nr:MULTISPECIES: UvrD-helicase domain-containing protein [Maribacter]MDC6406284.1 UvrD-helicase domain-containing protein [Maribacter sp. PR66]MEE1973404.1 UvrD-helicase domain-containing protein [Maribacter flavus]